MINNIFGVLDIEQSLIANLINYVASISHMFFTHNHLNISSQNI